MTITRDQIVLAESQVMADTEDGGGRMSGNVVEEGAINNTMPDISRLDRVYGRVNLRKLFLSVRAPNQDTLLGAHSILLRKPLDPRVAVTLFQTGSHTDRREDARDRIEAYQVKSSEARFWLWGTQLEGQRGLACLAQVGARNPEPGEIYCLTNEDSDNEQYVRVTEVEAYIDEFFYAYQNQFIYFDLKVINLKLSNELERDFPGSDPHPGGRQPGSDIVYRTQVADAARYFGAATLSQSAEPGDTSIQINSVYTSLVPSAQSETALTDQFGGLGNAVVVAASEDPQSVNYSSGASQTVNNYSSYYTGRAITPGSLTLTVQGGTYTDGDGSGFLTHESGADGLGENESHVDYVNGTVRVRWANSSTRNANTAISFTPAAAINQQSYADSLEITIQNRSLVYVHQPRPVPAPGTYSVEFMALGRWNSIYDRGDGVLQGDGVGQVNFATGTVEVTLAALPDAGPEILFSWGDGLSYAIKDGDGDTTEALVSLSVSDALS